MENYNLNIEETLLSSILYEPSLFEDVASDLKFDDFYSITHQKIFQAMSELEQEDEVIADEFILKKLKQQKNFNEESMFKILSTSPVTSIQPYIKQIREFSNKRKLARLSTKIHRLLDDGELNTVNMVDTIQSDVYNIMQNTSSKDFKDSETITNDAIAYIDEMKSRGTSALVGIDTGFFKLNEMTSGFGKGDLIIIAARPAMGKTAFALNIALHSIEKGNAVAFFSLEMPAEQLMLRMFSAKLRIPLQNIRVGNLDNNQWTSLSKGSQELAKKKFFVDDEGSVTIHQVKAKLRKLKNNNPELNLVIIDYLQLMTAGGKKDRHQEVSEMSRGLKLLARELNLSIIALSQLNRGVESRNDKRPMLSDLRESGAIEQDADIILFVYREDVYKEKSEKEKEAKGDQIGVKYQNQFEEKKVENAEIIIGKQRNGPTGIVKLEFHKAFTKFVEPLTEEKESSFQGNSSKLNDSTGQEITN